MFQLAEEELVNLKVAIATLSRGACRRVSDPMRSPSRVWRCCRASFVARAVQVNIEIMRAFVRLREMLQANGPRAEARRARSEVRLPVQGRLPGDPRADDSRSNPQTEAFGPRPPPPHVPLRDRKTEPICSASRPPSSTPSRAAAPGFDWPWASKATSAPSATTPCSTC